MNVHPFEKAGLGQAPFRCVGMVENVFMLPDGNSKAGGFCDYCYTGIRYEFHIESADQKKFKVGCDCVRRTGLITGFSEVRAKYAREKRQAGAAVRREAREAEWAAQRAKITAERREAFESGNATLVAQLLAYTGKSEFIHNMKTSLLAYGSLTEKQTSSVQSALSLEVCKAGSEYVGNAGDKITLTLTVVNTIRIDSMYGVNWLSICTDEQGNIITYKGKAEFPCTGETATIKATVKEHTLYDGVKQTAIQRPKIIA
jgi:hypothetical protein